MKNLKSKSLILKSVLGVGALALTLGNASALDTQTFRPNHGSDQKSDQKDDKKSDQKSDQKSEQKSEQKGEQKGKSTLRSKTLRPGQGSEQKGKDLATLNHHENNGKGQQKGYSKGDMMVRPGHGQQKGQQKD